MWNHYVIENENDPTLFWSNVHGWVDFDNCDGFTPEEKETLNLPIEGKWVELILAY